MQRDDIDLDKKIKMFLFIKQFSSLFEHNIKIIYFFNKLFRLILIPSSDNGKIIKAVNALSADSRHGVRTAVIEEIQVLPTHVPVRGLRIMRTIKNGKEETRLIVVSDSEVQSLKVHRCDSNKISSCR